MVKVKEYRAHLATCLQDYILTSCDTIGLTDLHSALARPIVYTWSSSSSSSSASLGLHSTGNKSTAGMVLASNPPCCRNFFPLGGSCHRHNFLWLLGGHGRARHRPYVGLKSSRKKTGRYPLERRNSRLSLRWGISAMTPVLREATHKRYTDVTDRVH
jgi:hypothetical protein